MFTISNQTDYAMLFIEYLAGRKRSVSIARLVDDTGLPRRYMAQIAAKLVTAGLVTSREGVKGGYRLAKPIADIKLYDILKIFEGDVQLIKCAHEDYECKWEKMCGHAGYWKDTLKSRFVDLIDELTVSDVIETSSKFKVKSLK